jgi:hypothetical protein
MTEVPGPELLLVDRDHGLHLLEQLLRIRRFEERCVELYSASKIRGFLHLYPPQVALVGLGRIAERPWASDGMLGVRATVRATVAADHRATDGLVAARFLATLEHLLQEPEDL